MVIAMDKIMVRIMEQVQGKVLEKASALELEQVLVPVLD